MRITNGITSAFALRALQRGQQQVFDAQRQVSTGRRLVRASDDPSAAAEAMTARAGLRALAQYRRNVDAAAARAAAEEGVLDQLGDILARASELAVGQATGTASAETRRMVQAEVDQLLRFGVSLANTKHGDVFLFGGERPDVIPFFVSEGPPIGVTSSLPSGTPAVEIGAGQTLVPVHDGTTVFGTGAGGPLAALARLSAALGANDPDAILAAGAELDVQRQHVDRLLGEVGARTSQLEVTKSNLEALDVTLAELRSNAEEVEFEAAVTALVSRQTAYQAAMLATSRVIGMSLTDYLR